MTGAEASPWDGRPALPKRLSDERFDARYEFAHLKFQKWTKRTSPRGGRPPVLGLVAQIPVLGMVARYTYTSNTHYTYRTCTRAEPVLGMAARQSLGWSPRIPVLGMVAHTYVAHTHYTYRARATCRASSRDGRPFEQYVLGRVVIRLLVGRLGRFLW